MCVCEEFDELGQPCCWGYGRGMQLVPAWSYLGVTISGQQPHLVAKHPPNMLCLWVFLFWVA